MPGLISKDYLSDYTEITAKIQKTKWTPGMIAKEALFEEEGIRTTSAFIEFENGLVMLIPAAARGGVGEPLRMGERTGVHIEAIHLPHIGNLMADEVQNRREFGEADLESLDALLMRKLAAMRGNLEATIEFHRLCAIKGKIMDADGVTVLVDLYAQFGISQVEKSLALSTDGSPLLNKVIDAQRASEDALDGVKPAGYLALAAPDFMDALRLHPDYKTALQYAAPSELTEDYRNGIAIGNVLFREYRSPVNGLPRVEDGTAYMVPVGVPDLFITRFAPADYVDTVNTKGQPIYARAEPKNLGKGYTLEAQSNVINLCTRPKAVIKLTAA